MITPEFLIKKYNLQEHPEGGWFKETYRSKEQVDPSFLPERFGDKRSLSTAIFFLLESGNFSAFHRIKSDECWHFYAGGALLIYIIQPNGSLDIIRLGKDIENGETYQYVVPANCWFASIPSAGTDFSFVGCTVAPGFDFNDFELAKKSDLITQYPNHEITISSLCRQ